jgi:hypothetical protein
MGNAISILIPCMDVCNLPSVSLCGNGKRGNFLTLSMGLLHDVEKMKHKSPRLLAQSVTLLTCIREKVSNSSQDIDYTHCVFSGFSPVS